MCQNTRPSLVGPKPTSQQFQPHSTPTTHNGIGPLFPSVSRDNQTGFRQDVVVSQTTRLAQCARLVRLVHRLARPRSRLGKLAIKPANTLWSVKTWTCAASVNRVTHNGSPTTWLALFSQACCSSTSGQSNRLNQHVVVARTQLGMYAWEKWAKMAHQTNQPTSQPTSQPNNQPTNQPTYLPTYQPNLTQLDSD